MRERRPSPPSALSRPCLFALAGAAFVVLLAQGSCSDGGGDTGAEADGGTCVEIDVTSADTTCASDSDCTSIIAGMVCPKSCDCPGTAVNNGAAAQFAPLTSPFPFTTCSCPYEFSPSCVRGQCTLVYPGTDSGPEAGSTAVHSTRASSTRGQSRRGVWTRGLTRAKSTHA